MISTPHFFESFFLETHRDLFTIGDNRSFDEAAVLAQEFEGFDFGHGFDLVFHVELAILYARFVEKIHQRVTLIQGEFEGADGWCGLRDVGFFKIDFFGRQNFFGIFTSAAFVVTVEFEHKICIN